MFDEARSELDKALTALPADDSLHRANIDLAIELGDPDAAQQALARWEAAESQGAEVNPSTARRVRDLQDRLAKLDPPEVLLIFNEATALQGINQNKDAADRWMKLAKEYPQNDYYAAPGALQMAGTMYWQAGAMKLARAAFQEILDSYPKSNEASSARTMLGIIPK